MEVGSLEFRRNLLQNIWSYEVFLEKCWKYSPELVTIHGGLNAENILGKVPEKISRLLTKMPQRKPAFKYPKHTMYLAFDSISRSLRDQTNVEAPFEFEPRYLIDFADTSKGFWLHDLPQIFLSTFRGSRSGFKEFLLRYKELARFEIEFDSDFSVLLLHFCLLYGGNPIYYLLQNYFQDLDLNTSVEEMACFIFCPFPQNSKTQQK
mmetsp:Transcript_64102/g.73574  ORF Transcript_64102/g.73574 Transcript_64102/m.73574 type:complete len:207 (+) Transcript_64102:228-848(+)